MKTKIKRHSRAVMSVVLSICILISCMTVGLIASDAAYDNSEEVGYGNAIFYLQTSTGAAVTNSGSVSLSGNEGTWTWTGAKNRRGEWLRFYIKADNDQYGINNSDTTKNNIKGTCTEYNLAKANCVGYYLVSSNALTVTFRFRLDSNDGKITVTQTTGDVSCSTDQKYIITGSQQLTNISTWQNTWSGAGERNRMTYDAGIGKYKVEYSNIAANKSSSEYFRFRILNVTTNDSGTNWETDKGYAQGSGAITDASNILQGTSKTKAGADNTFQFSLSANANITIYFDDSKLSTNSAIEVIVTPAFSTVTPGTQTGGTVKVNNSSSAVDNIAYGGSVTLTATAADYYTFSQWNDNSKLSYANSKSATTTATVTGSTTVNATFTKNSYTVSKGTGTGFTITAPASTQTKQWDSSVSVTAAVSSNLYYIDYLYYINAGEENITANEHNFTGGTAGAGSNTTLTGSFTMPHNNVTVYAHTHKRPSYAVNYAVSTDEVSAGHGYVNAGMQYSTSSTNVTKTITSGDYVLQNEKVNIGARAEEGYRFVGWYPNADGSGTVISTNKDVTVTVDAAKNYYAKFESLTASEGVRIYVPYAKKDQKVWIWGTTSPDTGTSGSYESRPTAAAEGTAVDLNGSTYYMFDYPNSSTVYFRLGDNQDQPNYTTGTYVADDNTVSGNSGVPTFDIFYPVKFVVTNPELAAAETYAPLFGQKDTSVTIYHAAADTDNNKVSRTTAGFTQNLTNDKTTAASTSRTMPASYAECTFTATIVPKDYYKVTFSAGAGGTVSAKAGGKTITSGTSVMEGTSVTITASPNSGYSVNGWTASGSLTGSSTNASRTFTIGADTTAKVYFSKSKGTDTNKGATILGYKESTSGEDNPYKFDVFNTTYVRNGRVYGYIEKSSTSQKVYDFQCYNKVPSTANDKKEYYTEQYYRGNNATWADTQFTADITDIARHNYDNAYDNTCYWIRFTASAKVKAIMIDLGPVESATSNKARPDNDNNTYHIIPIYNTDINTVTVYAKDASYRADSIYDYLSGIADTVISSTTGVTNISKQTEFETAVATKGQSITVTTTIDSNHRGRYYVRGYSVNGVTPELYNYSAGGVYTMTYTIPADMDDDYLEITPIYAENGVTNVRFYIENYDEAFQNTGWGNTLAVYPFYENASGSYAQTKHNAFGGYPGQPVINNGGRRFIEVPTNYTTLTVDGTTEECHVKGVTLSNDYFDIVHRDYCREVDDHLQTYDYDDFYKIYKETSDGYEPNGKSKTSDKKAADQITFAFKHRTVTNNFSDNTTTQTYSDTGNANVPAPYESFEVANKDTLFENGWEPLLDYHDRPIDLFGKQLSNADQTKEPLLVVSDDYAITYAGRYATTWTVYRKDGSNYTKITEIAPSALIVGTKARLGTDTYPAVTDKDGFPSTDGHKLAEYADEYQALIAYANTPVQITYESAIRNQDGYVKHWSMSGGSSEVAKRSDGRWFYSYMNEAISANLRIDYGDEDYGDDLSRWSHDTYKAGTNTGSVTGATVNFTNTATDEDGSKYNLSDPALHDTADYDGTIYSNFNHYYKFAATEGSGYIFMGWYMERDGVQTAVTPDNVKQLTGQSQMTSNATFVARYVKNPAGHLTINHEIADGSTGTATTYIKVEKSLNGTDWSNVTDFVRQDSYSINDTDIMSYNSGYTLRVTLKTVVAADTSFERFSASAVDENDHSSDFFSADVSTQGTTSTTTFEIPVDDLFTLVGGFPQQKENYDEFTYYSHTVKKPELTIRHTLDPESDVNAEGNTFVKVEVTDSGKTTVYATYGGTNDGYIQNGDIVIPSNYFNATGRYYLKIYLKTDMLGFSQFSQFSVLGNILRNAPGEQGQEVTIGDANSKRTKTATVIFPVSALFSNGEPTLTELPYLSKLIMPDYKYQFKYTVPSYLDKTDSISYTAKDSFAPEELEKYMTLINGDLAFQDDTKKKTFVCSKAPYEDNFQKTINFYTDFDTTARNYTVTDYTLSLDLTVNEAQQQTLDVRIKFPYVTKAGAQRFEYDDTDGKVYVVESNETNEQLITGVYGRDWITLNGVRNKTIVGTPEYIKAPLIIYNNNGTADDTTDDYNEYFKYWKVETVGTAKNASREYTRCYDYEFNLSIFQDSIITPVYDTNDFGTRSMPNPPTTYNGYSRFDPDVNRTYYTSDELYNGVSITFLENSRNQYNNGDAPATAPDNRKGAADRIYSDFLLTFDHDPKAKLQNSTANTKQAGLIIQAVAYLQGSDAEGYTVKEDTYYSSTAGYEGATTAQIKDYLEKGTPVSRIQRSKFDVTELDNKNRIQYYYGFDNALPKAATAPADDDEILRVGRTYNNQKIVYKAFAYIGDGTANDDTLENVVVSAQPIYFTFYGDATIAPGYYVPSSSGS